MKATHKRSSISNEEYVQGNKRRFMPKEVDIHVEKPAAKSSSELLVHGNMQKEIDIHDRTGRNACACSNLEKPAVSNAGIAMPENPADRNNSSDGDKSNIAKVHVHRETEQSGQVQKSESNDNSEGNENGDKKRFKASLSKDCGSGSEINHEAIRSLQNTSNLRLFPEIPICYKSTLDSYASNLWSKLNSRIHSTLPVDLTTSRSFEDDCFQSLNEISMKCTDLSAYEKDSAFKTYLILKVQLGVLGGILNKCMPGGTHNVIRMIAENTDKNNPIASKGTSTKSLQEKLRDAMRQAPCKLRTNYRFNPAKSVGLRLGTHKMFPFPYINRVVPGSQAEKHGIRKMSFLVKVNDIDVCTTGENTAEKLIQSCRKSCIDIHLIIETPLHPHLNSVSCTEDFYRTKDYGSEKSNVTESVNTGIAIPVRSYVF